MTMKKNINGPAPEIMSNSNSSDFPKGFEYLVGEEWYKVVDAYQADNAEMRRLKKADGSEEDVTVQTMRNDFDLNKNGGFEVTIISEGSES